ncbi:MAG: tRNA (adenosine(37)-N6)-threonylcarbamoyltransferase complex dimerization subunit type 1 TsaB [Planctomycetota bacterium]|nr:tRNA (adenosine(37)-N6)-threonylcarbamoyltransferase complex dimerization subunit type 1 TsaB [Planctomycetota bacterium]
MDSHAFDIALETSTRQASLAVARPGSIEMDYLADDVAHASDLLPLLETSLDNMGLERSHLRCVHVGIGPGSFTGLRVGCTIALGLAEGLGAKLCAVPSVAATAWASLQVGERGTVVLDARGGALYLATYTKAEDDLLIENAPYRLKVAEARALELPESVLLGDSKTLALLHGEERSTHPWRTDAAPNAGALLHLGLRQIEREGTSSPEQVRPLYMAEFGA